MFNQLKKKIRIFISYVVPRVYNLRDIVLIMWLGQEFYIEKWGGNTWRS